MRARQHVASFLLPLPLTAVLLLAGCAGSSTSARQTPSPMAATSSSASPSSSPSSSPSGSIPTDISQLGWVKLSTLAYPDALAVVPSMPNVLSSCSGAANAGKTNGAITFSASTDGGKTWQTTNTPALAGVCTSLAISPTTPQDVAMYSSTCRGDCGAATQTLYVTTDGGKTWALASSDDSGEAGAVFGWVGATLFANGAPAVTPHAAQQFLAKSTSGGPYSWTTLPAAPGQILTSGTTLYVVTGSQTSCAAPGFCSDLWASPDLGATWSHLTPTYQGNNLRVEAVASGTGTLFAYDTRAYAGPGAYPLYRSADGGRTWQQLPAIADTSLADTDALAAPDGTLYVTYVSVGAGDSRPAGIYKLAPGASAWHLVSPVVPAQIHAIAIQSDAAGHPAALWGLVFSDRSLGGAWSHPA